MAVLPNTPTLLPEARWRVDRECGDDSHVVLDTGTCLESSGYSTGRLLRRLPASAATEQLIDLLHYDGVPLSGQERAVHARVRAVLGHGAFAAVAVSLVPSALPERRGPRLSDLNERTILTADSVVGAAHDKVSDPPVVALAMGETQVECLILTWCHAWEAYRVRLRSDAIVPGADAFRAAIARHPASVTELLERSRVAQMPARACAN